MKVRSDIADSSLFTRSLVWIVLVFVAWLFTPGGQAVILVFQFIWQNPGGFAAELPLESIRFWGVRALIVAFVPPLGAMIIRQTRRSVDEAGRLTRR
jgi:hypothetical protein